MRRLNGSTRSLCILAAIGLAALVTAEAEARVGGGQSYGGGGRSSGGGFSGGGGGGGGGGDLVFFLIRLCVYYPEVGIPLLVCVVGWTLYTNSQDGGDRRRMVMEGSWESQRPTQPKRRRRATDGWNGLTATDPGLSRPVLYDFLQLVIRRVWAAGASDLDALRPFATDTVLQTIQSARSGLDRVDEMVIGTLSITNVSVGREYVELSVHVAATRQEHKGGSATRSYVEELWTFRRAVGARSLAPEDARRLDCPSCGAAVQCDRLGRCTNCDNPITEGQLQWQASGVALRVKRPAEPPQVGFFNGNAEPSYTDPTRAHPDVAARVRRFHGRHPQFDQTAFRGRVEHAFVELQRAWSEGRWMDARPYTTDASWNTLRFWLEQYKDAGLSNRLDEVQLEKIRVVDVEIDAWYESMTVRIWASMKDWTEDHKGAVVGGNRDTSRKFSEYWTFIRAVGSGDNSKDPSSCPSCGAPLDKINAAGVCGYCDSVITTGQYDWVLSRIDQAESYRP